MGFKDPAGNCLKGPGGGFPHDFGMCLLRRVLRFFSGMHKPAEDFMSKGILGKWGLLAGDP
jgi:hypothetical protein